MAVDLNALATFAAVAEARGFRAAADRLGVTRSAVSQTMQRLEASLGVALLHRTTRSVGLTEAGERLYAEAAGALTDLNAAVETARDAGIRPRGRLRLAVSSIAERFIAGPLLASFLEAYPEVGLDITVTDDEFDIVAHGFDAGVRLGEVIERDMIAVPVSAAQRQIAVASPAYLDRHGTPVHPRDLAAHRCIGWRPAANVAPYRWEFAEGGRWYDVAVEPMVTSNDMGLMIRLALAGAGITFGVAESFREPIARGDLIALLEEYGPPFAGFFLYFPSRRTVAPKLRALIEHVRHPCRRDAP
ncbi:MAG: LysR family transcriptional regulator [Paracoccaceae bacterium]